MNVTPLQGELEILEDRRVRLEEMLDADIVSAELRQSLIRILQDVKERIALCRCSRPQSWIQSRAA